MSTIALQRPNFSRKWSYGKKPDYQVSSSPWSMWVSSKSILARKEKELHELPIVGTRKFNPSNMRLQQTYQAATINQDDAIEFELEHFVAQLDEEYWAAAWLRAESHWEGREHDRYAEIYIRKFAEQEFNGMRKRYNAQLGENCKCIVMARKEGINVKRTIVVGTLDLSVREQTSPWERIKPPLFRLVDGKSCKRYGYITNLCVAKSARRKGIASRMLHFAIESAKAEGAEQVFVHVYKSNISAQGLYQKLGFQVVDASSSQISDDQTYLLCLEASNYMKKSGIEIEEPENSSTKIYQHGS